ncbi:hypothetical protein niasHS_007935 [Heterodera schachtii]|uniref:Uncharacterized protein n=1 Tax=Heterodera schachtii TaxID=97005 RepID=A0ABD2JQ23_HETSC
MVFFTLLAFCLVSSFDSASAKAQSVNNSVRKDEIIDKGTTSSKNGLLKMCMDSGLISNGKAGEEAEMDGLVELLTELDEHDSVIQAALANPTKKFSSTNQSLVEEFEALKCFSTNNKQIAVLMYKLHNSVSRVKTSLNEDASIQNSIMHGLKNEIDEAVKSLAIHWQISLKEIVPNKKEPKELLKELKSFWNQFNGQKGANGDKSEEKQNESHYEKRLLKLMADYSVCLNGFDKPKSGKKRRRRRDDGNGWTKKTIFGLLILVVIVIIGTFVLAKVNHCLCDPRGDGNDHKGHDNSESDGDQSRDIEIGSPSAGEHRPAAARRGGAGANSGSESDHSVEQK